MKTTKVKAALGLGFLVGGLALAVLPPAASMPRLMDKYNDHPLGLKQNRDKCVICHVNANGSGALTPFGERYDRAGLAFTPELVREYPNLFQPPGSSSAAADTARTAGNPSPPGGAAVAGAAPVAGPAGAPGAVPGNEPFEAARYFKQECAKCHGKYGDGDPLQGVPAFATKRWIDERSSKTEELLHILLKGKDKMIGQEGKITEEQARQLLELIRSIATQYS